MVVQPHMPLKPRTAPVQTPKNQAAQMPMQGGGGGRGGGGNMMMEERAGSTRILSILPEGTWVKAGDVVCELDSAAFKDELLAQTIRYDQAKSWVEQAKAILRVSEIAVQEYKEGIYVQDRHLIANYTAACRNNLLQAQLALDYSKEVYRKGMRTPAQLRADENKVNAAQIALREAEGMKDRLEKFSAPRLIKNLEAKIASVQADLKAQEATFILESQRKRKLEQMIDYCNMRAPRDGIVVYAAPAQAWGRPADQIREGVTVRQGQDIFKLPDPNHMRVRAKINESKIALIQTGQSTDIRIDAFPDRPMTGKVKEVTQVPAPALGPISDVKLYYAMVDIDTGGFAELKPGLSAEVDFDVDSRHDVTRVPVKSVRWVAGAAFVALPTPQGPPAWRRVKLGLIGPAYAEILEGLQPGDRIVADPGRLEPPKLAPDRRTDRFAAGPASQSRG
jgi:multidrug resistance efflux pump